ncbi:MAG: glycoside hydrolase family 127 protein [Eubacteriales bacterium]|nr:glycoside hydrolase family 127 protein [Eubacteriales bacterium]
MLTADYLHTALLPSMALDKQRRNTAYLMELKEENLLFSFYSEAGLNGLLNYKPEDIHWGWDSPVSQIRGMFTGHWLSAAARLIQQTGDKRLRAKAEYIVDEIGRCQAQNGNGWAFPIPEKYLYAVKGGQHFWAPQYVCHKIMMGLLDMAQAAGYAPAMDILLGCARWFTTFVQRVDRKTMDDMMDLEETGGIMELWADLYDVTKDPAHLALMRAYERPRLTEPLLKGVDVLTNMHANTTIPEIHGCARAYEVTGEERYRRIVEAYWAQAVTKRGMFATGGQTSGEVWTPPMKQAARLGDMNQEHCVVYNMIRLADYLYRWTGEPRYADYIERSVYNGLFAQGFWEDTAREMVNEPHVPDTGLVAYYLPLAPGSQKQWGGRTENFWCCHGTLVQANARLREWIYYTHDDAVTVAQYLPSEATLTLPGGKLRIRQRFEDLGGESIPLRPAARMQPETPDFWGMEFDISCEKAMAFTLRLRLPWWLAGKPTLRLNGQALDARVQDGYLLLALQGERHHVALRLPKALTCWALPDASDTVAFLDGPVALAGLCEEERVLYGDIAHPETLLRRHNERRWTQWLNTWHTNAQDHGFVFKPLYDIGRERYTVYFPVRPRR